MLDGGQDGVVRVLAAQELQHQRARPDHGDRVGDALAIDVRRRPVHGFEQRREFAFRVQVRRRRDADGAGAGRAQVRQDVAEQVGRNHHVEALRLQHEACRQNVDVLLVGLDVGVVLAHGIGAFVPPRHADGDAIALGGHRQLLAFAAVGQFERVAHDAVGAGARDDGFLDDDFAVGVGEQAAAKIGVFAFAGRARRRTAGQGAG
ncbi:hypothetical protein G6F68_015399 [Rhizopus microsporus]|nr:hypothetical protein G6F68_015399 [Rhizopus microsporus]